MNIVNIKNSNIVVSDGRIQSDSNKNMVSAPPRNINHRLLMRWIEFALVVISLSGKANDSGINRLENQEDKKFEVKATGVSFYPGFELYV